MEQQRKQVQQIFEAALNRVKGVDAVRDYLAAHPVQGQYKLIAFGKAAASMALGALEQHAAQIEDGLVITKHGHIDAALGKYKNIHTMESDHPVPASASLRAGQALIDYIIEAPKDAQFLVLISGGASSLVEVLADGMDLQKLSELTGLMLSSGLDITQMNQIRRSISRIKGGRLANYLAGRKTLALMISDVPGDNPAVIGSGPLTPIHDQLNIASLPQPMQQLLAGIKLEPVPDASAFANLDSHVIATLDDAKQAAAQFAKQLSLPVIVHSEFIEGDAAMTADRICKTLLAGSAGIHIWGGETAVMLPDKPGRGGRNQHLALAAAIALQGSENIVLLAAGTDGTDGPTEDAGGLVDGGTVMRATASGLDAQDYLHRADAGTLLEKTGDLVTTGPTGTNVMDLVIAYKW